jgi:hypothetical protein
MTEVKKIKNGMSYEKNGWLYVSIMGEPRERGYAYGYLIAKEMKKVQEMLAFTIYQDYGQTWEYFIEAGEKLLKEKTKTDFPEFYEEMIGVAEGCVAGGTPTTIDEILAWNNYFLLTESWYNNQEEDGTKRNALGSPRGEGPPRGEDHQEEDHQEDHQKDYHQVRHQAANQVRYPAWCSIRIF